MSPLFGGGKKDDGGEASRARSAAEREAARLERERRRAEREGRPLPPAPEPPVVEPEPDEPLLDVPAFEPEPPRTPTGTDPVVEAAAEDLSPIAGEGTDPVVEPAAEDLSVGDSRGQTPEVEEPAWETVPPEEQRPDTAEVARIEAPAGVRRVASVSELPQVGGPRPTPPGPVKGPAGKPPRKRGVPRARRGATRVLPLLFLALLIVVAYFAYKVFQPGHDAGDAKAPVVVTIARGATASEIADELEEQGVIDSAFFFNLRSRVDGRRSDLKAGRFTLKRNMSYAAALDALTQNPATAPVVNVTLPEGRSISEAASLVRQSGVSGSYVKAATKNPRTVKGLKGYGVPKGTRSLEGFLFPATYELKRGSGSATASKLVTEQLAAFKRTFDPLDRKAARRKNLNDYDLLIIASMIEREAGVAKDRRLISAVIYNRLQQHIPLGIDATLRYRLDNWSKPLKQSELETDSAFNTRLHQGLPPTPIGSPGLASIKAALNPAKVDYLYYVVRPCGNGAHAFSSSDAQFQKDVAAYNRKRNELGGKDPSHC